MATMQERFYEKTDIEARAEEGFAILLDGRTVKTPARRVLIVPSHNVAQSIAQEFNEQQEKIDPTTMPMTRLANTVIDGIADNPHPIAEDIMRFIAADMLFYRADNPIELVEQQRTAFDPVLDFIETRFSCRFTLATGVRYITQSRESLNPIRTYLNAITSPFALGGMHTITTLTSSGLMAIALREGAFDADTIWSIAHFDEDWTARQWGQDAEALARRQFKRREFDTALAFLKAS